MLQAPPASSVDSSQDAQKPCIRTTSNEALCILLRFWRLFEAIGIAHLPDDFLPRPFKCIAIAELDAVGLGRRLHVGEAGKERAEQLELALRLGLSRVDELRLDLRQHLVDVVEIARQIAQPVLPWTQLRIVIAQAIDHLLQLNQSPDAQLVPVVLRCRAVEMIERSLVIAAIVEDVAEVDPVSYTHLRAHETRHDIVCRLLLEKKKQSST